MSSVPESVVRMVREQLQTMDKEALIAIVTGLVQAQELAARELADRGLGLDGRWVGFEQAEAHWKKAMPLMVGRVDPPSFEILNDLARHHFDAETLVERLSDRLDFHEVSVRSMKEALTEAYVRGQKSVLPTLTLPPK